MMIGAIFNLFSTESLESRKILGIQKTLGKYLLNEFKHESYISQEPSREAEPVDL